MPALLHGCLVQVLPTWSCHGGGLALWGLWSELQLFVHAKIITIVIIINSVPLWENLRANSVPLGENISALGGESLCQLCALRLESLCQLCALRGESLCQLSATWVETPIKTDRDTVKVRKTGERIEKANRQVLWLVADLENVSQSASGASSPSPTWVYSRAPK